MTEQINKKAATNATALLNQHNYSKSTVSKSQEQDSKDTLFETIEPWSEPVNGQELFNDIEQIFSRYLFLQPGASTALTLWAMHTYGVNMFDYTPRLTITSPEPRCGKSTLLNLLNLVSYKPILAASITAAAMFRTIEKDHPTILIDEADTFLRDNEDLRGILNAGFEKNGRIIRTEQVGKNFEPRAFKCFSACAIASIGSIANTIMDRSIVINMRRKTRLDRAERFRTKKVCSITQVLRQKCRRFIDDNWDKITDTEPVLPDFLNDRAADIWEPLVAIATVISDDCLQKTHSAINKLAKKDDDAISITVQLLGDIRQIFGNDAYIDSITLVNELNKIEDSPWAEWNRGREMTVHSLAGKLKLFGIKPRQDRAGGYHTRKYYKEDFADAFSRYLPAMGSDCASVPVQAIADADWHDCTLEDLELPF